MSGTVDFSELSPQFGLLGYPILSEFLYEFIPVAAGLSVIIRLPVGVMIWVHPVFLIGP
jgi:hypothetical protein